MAERIFDALPPDMIAADGIRIPEYFLRWHQSNALSIIGEGRIAAPLRERALTLSDESGDLVGRSRTKLILSALPGTRAGTPEVKQLVEHLRSLNGAQLYPM